MCGDDPWESAAVQIRGNPRSRFLPSRRRSLSLGAGETGGDGLGKSGSADFHGSFERRFPRIAPLQDKAPRTLSLVVPSASEGSALPERRRCRSLAEPGLSAAKGSGRQVGAVPSPFAFPYSDPSPALGMTTTPGAIRGNRRCRASVKIRAPAFFTEPKRSAIARRRREWRGPARRRARRCRCRGTGSLR